MLKTLAASMIAATALVLAAKAAELKPVHAFMTEINGTSAMTYYTTHGAAFRVVTLLQETPSSPSIQIVSMLRPGDHTVITIPHSTDSAGADLWMTRVGDRLLIGPKGGAVSN